MQIRLKRLPAAFLFVFAFGVAFFSAHSSVTWRHLATGEWVLRAGGLPQGDPFSYMARGRSWRALDWLGDAAMATTVRLGGESSLIAIKAALVAGAFAAILPLIPAATTAGTALLALAAFAGWRGFAELPSFFDFPLFVLFLRILRPRRTFQRRYWLLIPGLECLWANLHPAGAALGLMAVAVKVFKAGLQPRRPDRGRWLGLLAAAALAMLVKPRGGSGMMRLLLHPAMIPPDLPAPAILSLYTLLFLLGLGAAWVCLQEDFFLSVSTAILLALSVIDPGWAPLAAMAAAPLIALASGHFIKLPSLSVNSAASLGMALLFLFIAYFGTITLPLAGARGFSSRQTPQGAIEFLDANRIQGRMFNDLGSSSYLMWRGGPDRPVFIDHRDIYDENFIADVGDWPRRWTVLDGVYRFDYAVVENRAHGYPCRAIDQDPAWALAYWDDASLVYVRREPANERVISKGAFTRLRPNDLFDPLAPGALSGGAAARTLEELDRALMYAPNGVSPLLIKALALQRLGNPDKAEACLRRAKARSFWKPELTALLGFVLEERGDATAAMSGYRQALQQAVRIRDRRLGAEISARLAALHLRQGQLKPALMSYNQALRLDPDNVEAARAYRSLLNSSASR